MHGHSNRRCPDPLLSFGRVIGLFGQQFHYAVNPSIPRLRGQTKGRDGPTDELIAFYGRYRYGRDLVMYVLNIFYVTA